MKNCNEIRENISLYIDDELSAEEHRAFEEHIASCHECKREYDEIMQIVGLCRDTPEVELPGNFKDELHRKLLDAAGETGAKSVALQRVRYIRIFSSIAAGFILIFLFGMYRFGLTPGFKASNSSTGNTDAKFSQMEGAKAQDTAGTFAAAMAAPAYNGAGVQFSDQKTKAADQSVAETAPEVGRSTSDANRNVQGSSFALSKNVETANSNAAALTILVDDPAAQAEGVRSIAVQNGGEEQQAAVLKSEALNATITADTNKDVVLTFSIPNKQYDGFVKSLDSGFGQANIEPGAMVSEDKTSALNDLIKQSNDIDAEVKKLEEADSKANTDKINELKAQLQTVRNDIENIRLNTDFTIVTVIIKKK